MALMPKIFVYFAFVSFSIYQASKNTRKPSQLPLSANSVSSYALNTGGVVYPINTAH
ncbi:uncharacterized protein NEPG_01916 [Nematocida parisii ERTm1]|uniref:Uncharacterized protein n=1 Tax=Nematocida parisii (strain ERTm3) TaxID=935791 RepID=I3EI26_NEMP3|nr:uncharacterized protein NEPG_01916 [Nematocida parisii ERTm1]EIJ88873.1 hypothetical protein NEQG_00692 [Nematocida parisii ERTm3]EIJ93574.1 hypothetical protein NEPG_01916 [Nematocida parisii ERTm1]|eukprot:XP_013059744.1 hypothetical protein NEPG_01916 [Nematocida parisii ERTm1]